MENLDDDLGRHLFNIIHIIGQIAVRIQAVAVRLELVAQLPSGPRFDPNPHPEARSLLPVSNDMQPGAKSFLAVAPSPNSGLSANVELDAGTADESAALAAYFGTAKVCQHPHKFRSRSQARMRSRHLPQAFQSFRSLPRQAIISGGPTGIPLAECRTISHRRHGRDDGEPR